MADIEKETPLESIDPRFLLTFQEEPHRSRRMEIIAKHPEVTKLNGPEPKTKWIVLGVCTLQITCAILLRNTSLKSPIYWLTAYFIGATCVSNLFLAIHEFSHNLGFKDPIWNRLFACVANLPVGIPYSASFGPYHNLHHKRMGEDGYDTDLPTQLEALFLSSIAGKSFFATFQLFFYALRPMFLYQIPFTWVHYANIAIQFVFNRWLIKHFGWGAYFYLLISAFLSGSLHPIAAHFIAEHYILHTPEKRSPDIQYPETFSYYGWLNVFVYNAGYHSEHHDFPYIAWSRLPELREIAKEFYDPLPYHTSWPKVTFDFILDDNITLWNRVKRPTSLKQRQSLLHAMEKS